MVHLLYGIVTVSMIIVQKVIDMFYLSQWQLWAKDLLKQHFMELKALKFVSFFLSATVNFPLMFLLYRSITSYSQHWSIYTFTVKFLLQSNFFYSVNFVGVKVNILGFVHIIFFFIVASKLSWAMFYPFQIAWMQLTRRLYLFVTSIIG